MKSDTKEKFQVYFAGASLAFGVPFFVGEILGLIMGSSPVTDSFKDLYSSLFVTLHLVGGLLGGYLVARRLGEEKSPLRAGVVTGVMAYLFQQIVYTIFYGAGAIGDIYTMVGLIGGSVAGVLIFKSMTR
ncbi:MAG: hypothetical protein NWE89_11160 [Candidatus Bathyarchaeota archaeon]|nr:hypothetical protein [Candidatus Bathyarchaeota archaeon]